MPDFGQHIDRNDVPYVFPADFSHNKPDNRYCVLNVDLGHYREGTPSAYVSREFLLRIRNSRRKAFLVNFPKSAKIPRTKLAQADLHATIVAAELPQDAIPANRGCLQLMEAAMQQESATMGMVLGGSMKAHRLS
jgi:hypothetical protein